MRARLLLATLLLAPQVAGGQGPTLNPEIAAYLKARSAEIDRIPADRRAVLERLGRHVRSGNHADRPARLVFICTHNSRRSHMAQLWLVAAARSLGVDGLETFSGGTEATAFNLRAIAALRRAGMDIQPESEGPNPRYTVRFGTAGEPITVFSKAYGDAPNPKADFAAVMTCSAADRSCPLVRGASMRVALPYDDPKTADGTPEEAAAYDARSRQIAAEMLLLAQYASAPNP